MKDAARQINAILARTRGHRGRLAMRNPGVAVGPATGRPSAARNSAGRTGSVRLCGGARMHADKRRMPPLSGWVSRHSDVSGAEPSSPLRPISCRASFPVAFIVGYPLLQLSSAALRHTDRFGHLHEFIGVDNFRHLWNDPVFLGALARTLLWTALVVGPTLALSMLVALILRQSFFGRGLAQMIVLLPWSISLTMTAVVWRRALNGESGLLNVTLKAIGLIGEPIVCLVLPGSPLRWRF